MRSLEKKPVTEGIPKRLTKEKVIILLEKVVKILPEER